jgi:hypothetical protein
MSKLGIGGRKWGGAAWLSAPPRSIGRSIWGEARHLRQHPKNDDRLGFDRVKFKS